jgi:hypothetical protein
VSLFVIDGDDDDDDDGADATDGGGDDDDKRAGDFLPSLVLLVIPPRPSKARSRSELAPANRQKN